MKSAATCKENAGFRKASSKTNLPCLLTAVGRMATDATARRRILKKPQTRCAQAKPTLGFCSRFVIITGYRIPPSGEPVDAKAMARARLLKK